MRPASVRAASIAGALKSRPETSRAAPRPGQRVLADVALQVHERPAFDVAELVDLERQVRRAAANEALQVVELAVDVDGHAFVPHRSIGLGIGAHRAIHSHRVAAQAAFFRIPTSCCREEVAHESG